MRIQITIRTLSHSNFDLEVDSTFTIEKIKELIEEKTHQSKATQTLIFAGKLLANELTLETANVKDQDFLVLVIKKTTAKTTGNPTPTQTPPAASSTPSSSGVEGPPQSTPTVETSPDPVNTSTPKPPDTPAVPTTTTTSEPGLYTESAQALVTGTQFQSMVDKISNEMGFPKEQVVIALRASFGNPDRAVDYLLSGEIPESVLNQTQPPPQPRSNSTRPPTASPTQTPQTIPNQSQQPTIRPPQTPQTPQTPQIPQPSSTTTNAPARPTTTQPRVLMTGGVVLPENIIPPSLAAQLPNIRSPSSNPTTPAPGNVPRATGNLGGAQQNNLFNSLRDNPMFASLQQLARNNPQRFRELMTQLISTNPQLGQLLAQHQNEFLQLFQGGAGAPALRPPGIQLQITPQDQEALERLTALGFSRNRVIEAYFLFEKSEDAAANYLLNTKDDEEEMEFLEGDMEDDDNPDDAN